MSVSRGRKGMGAEQKGYLTIFLTLTLTLMVSLCLTLVEGVRRNTMVLEIECVTDTGMNSILAEYHRELLKQYGMFFVDTSYGTGIPSYENTAEHLRQYLQENLGREEGLLSVFGRDLLDLHVGDMRVLGVSAAADDGGAVLRRQAAACMEEKIGISYLREISDWMQVVEEYDLNGDRMRQQEEQARKQLEAWEQGIQGDYESVLCSEANQLLLRLRSGILNFVTDMETISGQTMQLQNCPSRRKLLSGTGINPDISFADDDIQQLLFHEYILEMTGRYDAPKEGAAMRYQTEYILSGQACDADNLRMAAERLMLFRETANAVHIIGSEEKMTLITELSEGLAAALTVPEASPAIQVLLVAAWAGAESLRDVKLLLQGKRVPLLKTEEEWYYGWSGAGNKQAENAEQGKGLCYADYLRIFLMFQEKEVTTYRLMDMMELDIRQTPGNERFHIDGCIDSVEIETVIISGYGYEFHVARRYGY